MSFLINWPLVSGDECLVTNLMQELNDLLQTNDKPNFIGQTKITRFDLGSIPPEITVTNIQNPYQEFYLPDNSEITYTDNHQNHHIQTFLSDGSLNSSSTSSSIYQQPLDVIYNEKHQDDVQISLNIKYHGNVKIQVKTELIINQPTLNFMVLPITLTITGFTFNGEALVVYLKDRINFCFTDPGAGSSLLKDISIESEVGDSTKQVLKNVSKIESFIADQLKRVVDNFSFPSYHSFDIVQPEDQEDQEIDENEDYIGQEEQETEKKV